MLRKLIAATLAIGCLCACAAPLQDPVPAAETASESPAESVGEDASEVIPGDSEPVSSGPPALPEVPEPAVSEDPPQPSDTLSPEETASMSDSDLSALLESLSTEQKVGQLFLAVCPRDRAVQDVAEYHLGGYVLFGLDFKGKTADAVRETIASYQASAMEDTGIPLLIATDEEGGSVVRVSSNRKLREDRFAPPRRLYQSGGLEAVLDELRQRDALLRSLGVQVNLAPVADVPTSPDSFMSARSLGLEAEASSKVIAAMIEQMRTDGIGSVLKHFPGYGDNPDTHVGPVTDARPLETFLQSDFLPFCAGIEAGRSEEGRQHAAVLVSHNIVTCMDSSLPASLSPAVHRILREDLAFEGVIMTDDLSMQAIASAVGGGSPAVLALTAGNDLILTSDYRNEIPRVLEALEHGTVSMDALNAACVRVLKWKLALGMLAADTVSTDTTTSTDAVNTA